MPPRRIAAPPTSRLCWILDDDARTKRARQLLIPLCVTAVILALLVSGALLLVISFNPSFWGSAATVTGVVGTGGATWLTTRKWATRRRAHNSSDV